MIDPTAVDRWLKRPIRDSQTAKRFTRAALERVLAKLDPAPDFKLKPHDHQLAMFLLAVRYPGYYLAADMGTGKTKVALDVFRYRRKCGQAQRGLVLVPSTSNCHEWMIEAATHAPEMNVVVIDHRSRGAELREQLFWEEECDLVVMTYRAFLLMVTKARHGKLELWDSRLARGHKRFSMVIGDESTALSNPEAVTTRALIRFTRKIDNRLALSGTPFSNDSQGLWAQFKFTDNGTTLGKSLGLYREAFYRSKQGPYAKTWVLAKGAEAKLHRMLRHGSIRYEASECLSLPKCTGGLANPLVRFVQMTDAMARHVVGLERQMAEAHQTGDDDERIAIYHRMRCLSSGFIPTDDGPHYFKENPKLDAFMQLLAEAPTEQFVCFVHMKATADSVIRELKTKGITVAEITGRVSDKGAQLEKFRKGARVMIGSRAAMLGLNLQFCQRVVFYETPDSVAVRLQAQRRVDRMGQLKPTFIHDIVVAGLYDGRILNALRQNKSVLDAVIDGERLEGERHVLST